MEKLMLPWMREKASLFPSALEGQLKALSSLRDVIGFLLLLKEREVLTRAHPALTPCHHQPCLLHNYQAFNLSLLLF